MRVRVEEEEEGTMTDAVEEVTVEECGNGHGGVVRRW